LLSRKAPARVLLVPKATTAIAAAPDETISANIIAATGQAVVTVPINVMKLRRHMGCRH
jgi:hypothetical protein